MRILRSSLVVLVFSCVGLAGCPRNDGVEINEITPSADMELALEATNDAMTATLLATELTQAVGSEEESLKAGTCPIVTRSLGTITVDYGTGCTPESGLVPGEIAGSLTLSRDTLTRTVNGTFTGLNYDGSSIDGQVNGSYTRQGTDGLDLVETMDLTIGVGGDTLTIVQDVTINIRAMHVVLDGAVDYSDPTNDYEVDATGVDFDYADLAAACPLPHAGVVTVAWEAKLVTIEFQEHSPDTGYVTVTSGPLSGDIPLCEYLGFL